MSVLYCTVLYRVEYSTVPPEAHRKKIDNWRTAKVNNLSHEKHKFSSQVLMQFQHKTTTLFRENIVVG